MHTNGRLKSADPNNMHTIAARGEGNHLCKYSKKSISVNEHVVQFVVLYVRKCWVLQDLPTIVY